MHGLMLALYGFSQLVTVQASLYCYWSLKLSLSVVPHRIDELCNKNKLKLKNTEKFSYIIKLMFDSCVLHDII